MHIQPVPGPGISWADGALESPHGRIEVSWSTSTSGQQFALQARVPEGIPAQVTLPDGSTEQVTGTGRLETIR